MHTQNTTRFAKALAVMMFIIFCSYGLGMWYGASEVARDLRRGCVGVDCKTGGDVLTVFWAILNGAMVRRAKTKTPQQPTTAVGLTIYHHRITI